MITKHKIGLLTAVMLFVPAVSLVFAATGNGGNIAGGQTALTVSNAVTAAPVDNAGQLDQTKKHWGRGKNRLFHRLGLNVSQEEQLATLIKKQHAEMKAVAAQVEANRRSFQTELLRPTLDMAKINDLQTQLKSIKGQMIDAHLNDLIEIKKILTPEQFEKFLKIMKHKKKNHGKYDKYRRYHHGDDDRVADEDNQ